MPSSYTSNLRLEMQSFGENEESWGAIRNTGIQSTEDAISGMATLSLSGAGDYTLTTNNNTADEARFHVLKATGALTGARKIVIPSVPKTYVILNALTGSFDLTIGTAAGTEVTAPSGGVTHVLCDGTDSYFAALPGGSAPFDIPGDINVAGNIATAGGVPIVTLAPDEKDPIAFVAGYLGVDLLINVAGASIMSIDGGQLYKGPPGNADPLVSTSSFAPQGNSFVIPGTNQIVQYGRLTVGAGATTTVQFPREFGSTSVTIVPSLMSTSTANREKTPTAVVSSVVSFSLTNPNAVSSVIGWIAIGS